MPIYEYACGKCSHTLDALQKMSDDPLIECPQCGEPALKRLISAPNFRLKGGGWYETDFKQDKQRNVLKSDSEPEKKPAKDNGKSADGKPGEAGSGDGKSGRTRSGETGSGDTKRSTPSTTGSSERGKAASAE